MSTRIESLLRMAEKNPADSRAHFGLAAEYERAGQWRDVVAALRRYLELSEDEGNAWGRLGHALRQLGEDQAAQEAYRKGVAQAMAYGHPTMAAEFEAILDDWNASL